MVEPRIIIPVLNRSFKTPPGPRWYLNDAVYLESLAHEDLGLLVAKREEYSALLKRQPKCVYVRPPENSDVEPLIREYMTKIQFLFNLFRKDSPAVVTFGALVRGQRKARLEQVVEKESTFDVRRLNATHYVMRDGINRETVSDFFKQLNIATANHAGLLLTLDRYNSALTRYDFKDGIVDISICLESLIESQTEVAFKCALYNTIVARSDVKRREGAFSLLQSVYSARSKIVHGDDLDPNKKPLKTVSDNWKEVVTLTSNALSYYILYLSEHTRQDWGQHQKCLALGVDKLITTLPPQSN